MRIVLDTNVLVAGLLYARRPPGRVLDLVLGGSVVLLWDDRLLGEYADVLARPKFAFALADVNALLDYVRLAGEFTVAQPLNLPRQIKVPDPQDLPFAEVAVVGRADALVTGNARHFAFLPRFGIQALTPAAFLLRWQEDASRGRA
ncbi:MAG: putative toxin-antitoxin system toxin component, PIN family [Chloroflexi bacterium RBG_16_64_43]|nr:MAG: putative toxin-antitoxin system toxin component, PIN family [Chloroflexi bacterium RBG_16_64_43]